MPLRLGGRSTTPAGWGSAAYNTLMLGPCHRGHRRRTGQCSVPDDAGGRVLDQRVALSHRPRRKLGKLLGCGLPDGLVLTPATTDPAVARTWMRAHTGTGLEGVVAKRLDQPYRPGRRGWQKLRTRLTAEAVVGGITGPLKVPQELILGRYDDTGRLRIVGRTTPLRPPTAARLGALLEEHAHAWPERLPAHSWGAPQTAYTRVRPNLVVEVSADLALDGLRWRHPVRFVRARDDLQAGDLPARAL